MFILLEQFPDPTEHKAEIYVYLVDETIVYAYDKYNGYVNIYSTLQALILREFTGETDIPFYSISKDEHDNAFEDFVKKYFDYGK